MWCQLPSAMKKHILKCPQCYPRFYTDECPDTGYFAQIGISTEETPNNYRLRITYGTLFHALIMSIKEYKKYPHLNSKKGYGENLKILRHIQQVNPCVQHLKDDDDDTISVSSVNESVTSTNTNLNVNDDFFLCQDDMYNDDYDYYY